MKFLRNLLAVLVGLFLFSFIAIFIFIGMMASLGSSLGETKVNVEANSILRIDLNRTIEEVTADDPFAVAFSNVKAPLGLLDLKRALTYAKTDDKIKGIYLDCGQVSAGYASLQELRGALLDFKESGKFVVSYSEMYSEAGYYLASAADEILAAQESLKFEFDGKETL